MEKPKFIKGSDNLPEFTWLEDIQAYMMKFHMFRNCEYECTYEYIVDAKTKEAFERTKAFIKRHQNNPDNFVVWMPSGISSNLQSFCYSGGLPGKPIRGVKTIAQIELNNDLRRTNLQIVRASAQQSRRTFYIPPATSSLASGKGSTPHGN